MEVRREGRSERAPYACARESHFDVLVKHAILYGGSTAEWQEHARLCRKLGNKQAWKRIGARRTCAFAVTLRRLEQVLGDKYAGRARVSTGTCWAVAAVDDAGEFHVVARVRATAPHTLEELMAPVLIEIMHPMVDVERLRRLTEVRPKPNQRTEQRPGACGMISGVEPTMRRPERARPLTVASERCSAHGHEHFQAVCHQHCRAVGRRIRRRGR
jgi:hypothetical protein